MEKKKQKLSLVLNEIKKTDDPTLIPCTFTILDFEESASGFVVPKDVAIEGAKTLINKPIVGHYYEVSEYDTPTDNFGSHEEYMGKDKRGNNVLCRDTTPIGVFTSEGYIQTIQMNGETKEVLVADAVLWYSKFRDACDLILEWTNRGVKINMSCEYLYYNYERIDGIEYHKSPIIFESHAILASEDRGIHEEVKPAYESATLLSINEINKFERLVAQAVSQEKGGTTVEEVKTQEGTVTVQEEAPTTTEPEVVEEVVEQESTVEEELVDVEKLKQENADLKKELGNLKSQLSEATTKKEEVEKSFNLVSNQIIQLNSQLEELKPIKEEFMRVKAEAEKAEREQKLVANTKEYEDKFRRLNAMDKFNSDEVKQLLNESIEEGEVAKEALYKLNSMLVDLVPSIEADSKDEPILMTNSKREGLMDNDDEFTKRFII